MGSKTLAKRVVPSADVIAATNLMPDLGPADGALCKSGVVHLVSEPHRITVKFRSLAPS